MAVESEDSALAILDSLFLTCQMNIMLLALPTSCGQGVEEMRNQMDITFSSVLKPSGDCSFSLIETLPSFQT